MSPYDPNHAPDPATWPAQDEQEAMILVRDYHEAHDPDIEGLDGHVAIHVVLENLLAAGEPATCGATLERHLAAGLDRHAALHAMGAVLAEVMHAAMNGKIDPLKVNDELARRFSE